MGHFRQTGMGYIFVKEFQDLYLTYGEKCVDHWSKDNVQISQSQFYKDNQILYGALQISMKEGIGQKELLQYEATSDGLRVWIDLL